MNQEQLKAHVGSAAAGWLDQKLERQPLADAILGVGTGSTVNCFIDALAELRPKLAGCVASSESTATRLQGHDIPVHDLNDIDLDKLRFYVDGADECTREGKLLIKGGGGALTREKILASVAKEFICIADETKLVDELGGFPLPVEVIPMAWSAVAQQLEKLGGLPKLRPGRTDNSNLILDVEGLDFSKPRKLEKRIDGIAGVVANGIFAKRPADAVMLATADDDKAQEYWLGQ